MEAIADSIVGVFAGATDLIDNLGWERLLVIPVFLGACALAMQAIRRIEATARRRPPPTFKSRMAAVGAKMLLAAVIFVVAYTMSISLSGPALPMVMMLGLLAASIVTLIREVTKRRARVAGLRS